jgi:phosphoesterase RecJ-like protein
MNSLPDKLQLAGIKLRAAQRVLLVGHTAPDADAIAALGAMIEVAQGWGLSTYAYADRKRPDVYSYIPNEYLVQDTPPEDLRGFEVILILDCGSISRTNLEARLRTLLKATDEGRLTRRPYIIEFDHHEPQDAYADLEIRLPDKASTTEIIYHFLQANKLPVTKTLANCILIGLMTDTGNFLHPNSSQEAIAISSEMLLRGASLPKIINSTLNNRSFAALKVWGRILDNLHFNQETGLVSSGITAAELASLLGSEKPEAVTDLFGDMASFLSNLSGARVALLLREEEDRVKGNLRTNQDDVDVAKLAQNWGGGGHKKAAGFSVTGRLIKTATGWNILRLLS